MSENKPWTEAENEKWIKEQQKEYLAVIKKKAKKKTNPPVATLTIRGIPQMDREDRLAVGTWLHDWGMSIILMDEPENTHYSKVFTARYEQ